MSQVLMCARCYLKCIYMFLASLMSNRCRDIKNAPKRKRETSAFVHEIRRRLFVLRDYNDRVAQVKGRFPYSKELFLLLVSYAKLEYDALYSKEDVSSTHEKEVERIVLHHLQTMFHSYDYNTIRYMDSKFSIHSAAKCALRVLNKLSKEYWEEGKLIHTLGIRLMNKLGLLDVATKIKESKGLVLLDSLWNSPTIQSLSEGHFEDTSDCDSDNADSVNTILADDSSSCASSTFIKKADFASRDYIKSDFGDFKFEETQKEPVVYGENRVPTIDLVHDDHDEEEYLFYMSSEVKPVRKKLDREIKVCYDSDCSSDYTEDKKLDLGKDFFNLGVHIVDKDIFRRTNINGSSTTDDLTLSANRCIETSKAADNPLHNVRSELLTCSNYSHNTEVIVIHDDDDGVLEVFEDNTSVSVYKQQNTSTEEKSDLVVNIENRKPLELVYVIDITSDDEEALLGADDDNDCLATDDNENDILDRFSDECANNIGQQPPTAIDNQVNEISSSKIFDNDESFGYVPEEESDQGHLHSNTGNSTYMRNNSGSYCERTTRVARPDVPYFNVEITSTTGKSYESTITEPQSLCSTTYKQPRKDNLSVLTECSNCINVQVAPLNSDLHEVDPVCSQNGNAHFKTIRDKTETDNVKTETTHSSVCFGPPEKNTIPAYLKNKNFPTKMADISTNTSSIGMSKYFSKLNLNSAVHQITVNESIGATTAGSSSLRKEEDFTQSVNQVSSHENMSDIVTKKDEETVCVSSNTTCGSHISFSSIRSDKTLYECFEQCKSNIPHKDYPEVQTDIKKNCKSNLTGSVYNDKKFHLSVEVHSSTQTEMLDTNLCVVKNMKEIPMSAEKHVKTVDDVQELCELDMPTNCKIDELILVDNEKTEQLPEMVKLTTLYQSAEREDFPGYGGAFINREGEKFLTLTENCETQGNSSQNGVSVGLDVDDIVAEAQNNTTSVVSETERSVTTTGNKDIQTIVKKSIGEIVTKSKKVQKVDKPKSKDEGELANACKIKYFTEDLQSHADFDETVIDSGSNKNTKTLPSAFKFATKSFLLCTIPRLLTEREPNVIVDNGVSICENSGNSHRNDEVLELLDHENDTTITVEQRIDVDAVNKSELSEVTVANKYDLQIAGIQVSDTDSTARNDDIISINRENADTVNKERSIVDKMTAPHSSESILNTAESISIEHIKHNNIGVPHTTEKNALVDTEKFNEISANQAELEIAVLNVNNSSKQLECVNIPIVNEICNKCDEKTSDIRLDNQTVADIEHFSESSIAPKPRTEKKSESFLEYHDNITAVPESNYLHDICEEINFQNATVSVSNTQQCENKVAIENIANMQRKNIKIATLSEHNLECSDYTKATEQVVTSDGVIANVKDDDTKIENDGSENFVHSVEEQSATPFRHENVEGGVDLTCADVINIEENNRVINCEAYSNHSDYQNDNRTLNEENLQVNEEMVIEASDKTEDLINDVRKEKHCDVNITNECSEITFMHNKKESGDNNSNAEAEDMKKFRGNQTREELNEVRTHEEQTEEEEILTNAANTEERELKSNNEKVFVESDNYKVTLEEIDDHSVCDADPCTDQLGIYVIPEDDNKEVTANRATDTKLLLVTTGFDNGNEERNTSVSAYLTVGENIIVESLEDVHGEVVTSNEDVTVLGLDDNNIKEQPEEVCVAPPKVEYEQTETEKSSEGNAKIHQFRNLSSVQSHECYDENINNSKELRAYNEDDCAAEVQQSTTRGESCEVENQVQGIYSDCEVFYNLEDGCQNMEITVAEVTITTENSDFVSSENAVLPQCEYLLSEPVELENDNSDNIEKESMVVLDNFRSVDSDTIKTDEYIPQKTDFVTLENGVLPHCEYTLNTPHKIENKIESESTTTLANYKSVQFETYKTDKCLPKETENLDVLAEAACIRKTLEVKTSVLSPVSIGDNTKKNRSRLKKSSKWSVRRNVESRKTRNTEIRKSLPRAAKIHVPVDYCNDGFKIRNTSKNAILKAAQDRCLQLSNMKCKPNDSMENVSEQPPNKIYAAEYNADFNTVSNDSCDSTVGLVIAEDIKPPANCILPHNSNVISKPDKTMFHENTVDNKLVPTHSEMVGDDVSSVLITIPECEDYDFQILQDVEQIKASPSSGLIIQQDRQELLVCKKLCTFEDKIHIENNSESLLTLTTQQNKQDQLSILNPLNVQQESERQEELSVIKCSASVPHNKLITEKKATETITKDRNEKRDVCVDSTTQLRSSIKTTDHRIETILNISVPSTSSKFQSKNCEQNMEEVGDGASFSKCDNEVQGSVANFRIENGTSECESVVDLSIVKRIQSVEGETNFVPYMLSHDGEILNPNYINEAKTPILETETSTEECSTTGKQTDVCGPLILNQETEDVHNENRDIKDHSNGFTATVKLEITDVLPIRTKAAVKSYMKDVYVRLLRIGDMEAFKSQYVSSLVTKKRGEGKHEKIPEMVSANITDHTLKSKSFESTLKFARGGFFNESKEQVKSDLNECEMKSKKPKAYASTNENKEEIVTARTLKLICNENVLFPQKNDIVVKDNETKSKDFYVQGKIKSGKNVNCNNEIQMKHDKANLKQEDKKENVKERRCISSSSNIRANVNLSERNRRRSFSDAISPKGDKNQLDVATSELQNTMTKNSEILLDVKNKKRKSSNFDIKTEQETQNEHRTSETKKAVALYDKVRENDITEKALEHKCNDVEVNAHGEEICGSYNNDDIKKYDSEQSDKNYKNNGSALKEAIVVHFVDVVNKSKREKKDNKKKSQLEKSIMLEPCLFKPDEISTVKLNHDRKRSNNNNRSTKKATAFKNFVTNSDVGVKESQIDNKNEDLRSQAHIDDKASRTISSDYENLLADLNGSKSIGATDDIIQSKTSPARYISSDAALYSNSKVMSEDKHKKSKRNGSIHMNALKKIANNLSGLTKQEMNSVTVNADVEKTRINENVGIKVSFDEKFGNKLQIENKLISSVRILENVSARRQKPAIKTEDIEEHGSKSMEYRESHTDMLAEKSQNKEDSTEWAKNNKSKMYYTKDLKYDREQDNKVRKEVINEKSEHSGLIQPEVLIKDLQKVNCVGSRKSRKENGKDIYQYIKENDPTATTAESEVHTAKVELTKANVVSNGSFKHIKDLNKLKAKVTAECEKTKRTILKVVEGKYGSITSNSTGIESSKSKIKSLTISKEAITDKEMMDIDRIFDKQSNVKDKFKEKEKCGNTILKCIETEINKSKIDSVSTLKKVKFDEVTLKMENNITDYIKKEEAINKCDNIHLKSFRIEKKKNRIEPVITSEEINMDMEVKCVKKTPKKESNIITEEHHMETVEKSDSSSLKSSNTEESETKIGSVITLNEVNTYKEMESEEKIIKKESNIIEKEETAEKINEIENNEVLTGSVATSSDELIIDKEMHSVENENSSMFSIAEKEVTVKTVGKSDSCSLKSAEIKEIESVTKTESESVMTSDEVSLDEEIKFGELLLNKETSDMDRIQEKVTDNCLMKVIADENSITHKRRLTTDQLEDPKKHKFELPSIEKLKQSVRNKMKQAEREGKTQDLKRYGGERYLTKAKESKNKRKSIEVIISSLRCKETSIVATFPVKNAAVIAKDIVDRRKSKESKNTLLAVPSYKSDNTAKTRFMHEESIKNLHRKSEMVKASQLLSIDASLTELNVEVESKDIERLSHSESHPKFEDHIQGVHYSDAHTEENSENDGTIMSLSVNNQSISQSLVMEKMSSVECNVSEICANSLLDNADKLIASEAVNNLEEDQLLIVCADRVETVPSERTATISAIVQTQEVERNLEYKAKNELVHDLVDVQVEIINTLKTEEMNDENSNTLMANVELNNDALVDGSVSLEPYIINKKFSSGCDNSRHTDNFVEIKNKGDRRLASLAYDFESKTHTQSIYDTSSCRDVLALSSIATVKDHVMSLYTKEEINDSTIVSTPSSYLCANKEKDNFGALHKIVTPNPSGQDNGIIPVYTESEINDDESTVSAGLNEELNGTKLVTPFLDGGHMTQYDQMAITSSLCAQTESTNSLSSEDEKNDSALVSTSLTYAREDDSYGVFFNKMPSSLEIPPYNDATFLHTQEEIRDSNMVNSPVLYMSTKSDLDEKPLPKPVSVILYNEELPTPAYTVEHVTAPTLVNDGRLDDPILIGTASTYLTTSSDFTQSSFVSTYSRNVPVSIPSTVDACPVKLLKDSPLHITVPVSNAEEFISAHCNVMALRHVTKNCDADRSKYKKAYSEDVLTSSTEKSIAASASEILNFVSSDAALSTNDERNFTDTCKITINSNKDNVITSTSTTFLSEFELVSTNKQCDGILDKAMKSAHTKFTCNEDIKAVSNVHMTEIPVSSCTGPISNQVNQMQANSDNLQTVSPDNMYKPTELQNTQTETDAFLQRDSSFTEDKHHANVSVLGHSLVKSNTNVMPEKYDNKLQNALSAALSVVTSQVSNFESEMLRSDGDIGDKELTSAVELENDEQVSGEEIVCDNKNRTIQIILESIDHKSLGGPFLCGEYETNELNQSAKDNLSNVKRHNEQGSREDLDNSPVDSEQMFHFAEQVCISSLIDNNLSQSSTRSLDESPVDSTNDYQLSEHDSQLDFSFIENQETTQSLDESTNIHDTNEANRIGIRELKNEYKLYMKQEREDEHRNLNLLIEDFKTQGGFECNTLMSVEKMNKLLHSNPQADDINIAIANLNNLLNNTQNQKSEKDKSESLYQHDDSTSSNECTVSSGCDFAFDGLAKLRAQNMNPLTNLYLNDTGNINCTTDTNTTDLISSHKHSQNVPSNNSNAPSPVLSWGNLSERTKSDNLNVLEKVTVKYNMHDFASTDNIFSESDFNSVYIPKLDNNNLLLVKSIDSNVSKPSATQGRTIDTKTSVQEISKLPNFELKPPIPNDRLLQSSKAVWDSKKKLKSSSKANSVNLNYELLTCVRRRKNWTPVSAPKKKVAPVLPPQLDVKIEIATNTNVLSNLSQTEANSTNIKKKLTITPGLSTVTTSQIFKLSDSTLELGRKIETVNNKDKSRTNCPLVYNKTKLEQTSPQAQHILEDSEKKEGVKLNLPLGSNKSESTKLVQISANKPDVKELPKIPQVITKETSSTSIEDVTKDKLNKLLLELPFKKSFIKLRHNEDVQKPSSKSFTDLKLNNKQPPTIIKEARATRQDKIDLLQFDMFKDKYDEIKSRRRKPTEKLIDSYSYEKRLKVEEEASIKYKVSEKSKAKPTAPAGHVPIFNVQEKKKRKRFTEDEDSNNSCKSKRSRKKVKSLVDYDESLWSDDLGKSKQTNALQKDSSSTSDDDIDKIKKEDRMKSRMDFNALFDQLRQEGDVRGKNVKREEKKREEPEYQEKKGLSKELDAKGNCTNNNRTEKKLPPGFRAFENLPKCSNGYTPDIHTSSFPNRLEKHVKSTNQSKNYSTDAYVHVQNSACHNQMRENEGHRYSHPDYRDRFSRGRGGGSHSSRYPSFHMQARHGGSSSNRRSSDYMHSQSTPLGHHSSSYSNSRRSQLRRGEKIDLTTFLSHHSKISKTNNDKHPSDCD